VSGNDPEKTPKKNRGPKLAKGEKGKIDQFVQEMKKKFFNNTGPTTGGVKGPDEKMSRPVDRHSL